LQEKYPHCIPLGMNLSVEKMQNIIRGIPMEYGGLRLSLENVMSLTSFLRRQESRQKTFISTLWIPAFAGMAVYYFSAKALNCRVQYFMAKA